MPNGVLKSSAIFSVFVACLALGYHQWNFISNKLLLYEVIMTMNAFDHVENPGYVIYRDAVDKFDRIRRPVRAAVGLGACMDVFVDAVELWEKLGVTPPALSNPEDNLRIPDESEDPDVVNTQVEEEYKHYNTIEDLVGTFVRFFKEGAAVERYVHNTTLFRQIVNALREMPSSQWALGGNAPVMASRFAKEKCPVLLGAKLNDQQIALLHPNISHINEPPQHDDVHIIMEYKAGTQWGGYVAPRANRFIIHSDQENPMLTSLESWPDQIRAFDPDILVISGLQMMDAYPFQNDTMERRLMKLRDILRRVPFHTRNHFEMASFVDEKLLRHLLVHVLPYMDSIGMNEQELPNLLTMLETARVTQISSSQPRLAVILEQMRRVWRALSSASPTGKAAEGVRKISRLHLHTLAYQVVMTRRTEPIRWTNTRRAAAAASLAAHRHACASSNVDMWQSKLLMDDSFAIFPRPNSPRIQFNSSNPVACWEEGSVEVCVAPVLVCTQVKQTAGGGDNISTAGLVPQLQQADKERYPPVPHYGEI